MKSDEILIHLKNFRTLDLWKVVVAPCNSRYPAGAVIKKRCERCGFVAPWRENFSQRAQRLSG
jgi:hypothetical protein